MKQAFVIAALCVAASGNAATLSAGDVRTLYSDLFAASSRESPSGKKEVFVVVPELPAGHSLSTLAREHDRLLLFLLENYSGIDFERFRSAENPQHYLTANIVKSDRLASVLLPLVAGILQKRGDKVVGARQLPSRSIALSEITRVAARFFYVDEITPEGRAIARICVGVNGLIEAPFARDPLLEAIAYAAIMRDWKTDRTVMPDFTRTLRQLRQTSDTDQALSHARNAMFSEMSKSMPLEEILKKEVARTSSFSKISLRQ